MVEGPGRGLGDRALPRVQIASEAEPETEKGPCCARVLATLWALGRSWQEYARHSNKGYELR